MALLGDSEAAAALVGELHQTYSLLSENPELKSIIGALDGRFVRPAPGGDLLRTREVLPTGRNLHGFDPFRIPSAHAVLEGARQIHDGQKLEHTQTRPSSEAVKKLKFDAE